MAELSEQAKKAKREYLKKRAASPEATEARRQSQKRWREANRERLKEYRRKWYAEHKEYFKEYRKKWNAEHPGKNQEYQNRYWEKVAKEMAASETQKEAN